MDQKNASDLKSQGTWDEGEAVGESNEIFPLTPLRALVWQWLAL